MREFSFLRKYSLRDLLPFFVSELSEYINRSYSSAMFLLKCNWHGIQLNRSLCVGDG